MNINFEHNNSIKNLSNQETKELDLSKKIFKIFDEIKACNLFNHDSKFSLKGIKVTIYEGNGRTCKICEICDTYCHAPKFYKLKKRRARLILDDLMIHHIIQHANFEEFDNVDMEDLTTIINPSPRRGSSQCLQPSISPRHK